MSRVYIVNKSFHDFKEAESFGEIIYLSEGSINRYEVNNMARQFELRLKESKPTDYIVLCSFSAMSAIACSIFATKHKKLNLLLYRHGRGYVERNIVL
jgi:hypothetical protein